MRFVQAEKDVRGTDGMVRVWNWQISFDMKVTEFIDGQDTQIFSFGSDGATCGDQNYHKMPALEYAQQLKDGVQQTNINVRWRGSQGSWAVQANHGHVPTGATIDKWTIDSTLWNTVISVRITYFDLVMHVDMDTGGGFIRRTKFSYYDKFTGIDPDAGGCCGPTNQEMHRTPRIVGLDGNHYLDQYGCTTTNPGSCRDPSASPTRDHLGNEFSQLFVLCDLTYRKGCPKGLLIRNFQASGVSSVASAIDPTENCGQFPTAVGCPGSPVSTISAAEQAARIHAEFMG